jgi:hypothetical protein
VWILGCCNRLPIGGTDGARGQNSQALLHEHELRLQPVPSNTMRTDGRPPSPCSGNSHHSTHRARRQHRPGPPAVLTACSGLTCAASRACIPTFGVEIETTGNVLLTVMPSGLSHYGT